MRSFGSDNHSGVHPDILHALAKANEHHAIGYGDDPWTQKAIKQFQQLFGKPVDVYFVFNGTAANVLALRTLAQPYQAVICSDVAHIHVDECGAPEFFSHCKLLTASSTSGKLTPELIEAQIHGVGDTHHVQPKVVSITQPNELGEVYDLAELQAIADVCKKHQLYLHMDGARIANAVASLQVPISEITQHVDALSFGGTKNGMMFGEALIFFNPELSQNTRFLRKQSAQLASKMRFISAQFSALLESNLYLKNAVHANAMATLLTEGLSNFPETQITHPVQGNAVFVSMPPAILEQLQKHYFFYVWNPAQHEVRLMMSYDTTKHDIEQFLKTLEQCTRSDN